MGKESTVTAFEAKTHLSDLLRKTERGESFRITRRGKDVARLVPLSGGDDIGAVIDELGKIRGRAKGPVNVRSLVCAGRKY